MKSNIDFVVTWVDGSDKEWVKSRNSYAPKNEKIDEARFRDWGLLRYWFRAIENNAPWVRKIHFVTCGHIPSWLNTDYKKINIVKHSDFMEKGMLPTFNSCAIEMNLHKIPGLSDKFVYFNDDMFLNRTIDPNFFFKNSKPRATYTISELGKTGTQASRIDINCNNIVKKYKNNRKELSVSNGILMVGKNILSAIKNTECGYSSKHAPASYLKSTYEKLWAIEKEVLSNTSMSKFRKNDNVSQWVFEYYQMACGISAPRNYNNSKYYNIESMPVAIAQDIESKKHTMICLNDSGKTGEEAIRAKNLVVAALESRYPNPSRFERSDI